MLSTQAYIDQLPNGAPPFTDIAALADQIAGAGIREVTGSVVGDESRYDAARSVPAWPERFIDQGQVAPLSALLVDDGWRIGAGRGRPARCPCCRGADRPPRGPRRRDRRTAPAAAPHPRAPRRSPSSPSLTVAELVAQALRFSDNTTTELLVKEIGREVGGGGSTEAGLVAIRDWLADSGLPDRGRRVRRRLRVVGQRPAALRSARRAAGRPGSGRSGRPRAWHGPVNPAPWTID